MKHLKLFENTQQYESYKNGSDYVLPHVSYVKETKGMAYEPKKAFTLRAKYNATSDNLVAFTGATNIQSLKVNGTTIKFEPLKNEISTFDVLGENISLDMETGTASFPESYLVKSPVSSWSFKAKDPNYTINENTYVCMLGMMDGMTLAEPIPLGEAVGYAFTTNDGVTLEAVYEFLSEMNMQIHSGLQIGFTLMDVDMDNQTFTFIDTEHQTNVTTGGMSTYFFDREGLYDVEIELYDPDMKGIQFAETPLISIEIGDGITSIRTSTFDGCSKLTSINIPASVKTIENFAFKDCAGLTSVYISDIAAWCNILFTGYAQVCGNPLSNGCNLYINNELVRDLIIPDGVTTIRSHAFDGCSMASVTIPASVTSIEDWAFSGSGLTEVTIGTGVTEIGANAFGFCRDLASITCYAPIAPTIDYTTFQAVRNLYGGGSGILYVPTGSDYSSWMSRKSCYLGDQGWALQYI